MPTPHEQTKQGPPLKALTLHQPWASLIAAGFKSCETRHWAAPHSAWDTLIAIHAGAREDSPFRRNDPQVLRCLGDSPLPAKAIVAVARLQDCIPTQALEPGPLEDHFGDFSPGRFAWRLAGIQPLSEPVPAIGHQTLWNVPADLLSEVYRRLMPPLDLQPHAALQSRLL